MKACTPVIVEAEREIVDNLSDIFTDYEVENSLYIKDEKIVDSLFPIILNNFKEFAIYGGIVTYYKAYFTHKKFKALFKGKSGEIDEFIKKYEHDEKISFSLYIWETIWVKALQKVNKEG